MHRQPLCFTVLPVGSQLNLIVQDEWQPHQVLRCGSVGWGRCRRIRWGGRWRVGWGRCRRMRWRSRWRVGWGRCRRMRRRVRWRWGRGRRPEEPVRVMDLGFWVAPVDRVVVNDMTIIRYRTVRHQRAGIDDSKFESIPGAWWNLAGIDVLNVDVVEAVRSADDGANQLTVSVGALEIAPKFHTDARQRCAGVPALAMVGVTTEAEGIRRCGRGRRRGRRRGRGRISTVTVPSRRSVILMPLLGFSTLLATPSVRSSLETPAEMPLNFSVAIIPEPVGPAGAAPCVVAPYSRLSGPTTSPAGIIVRPVLPR